MLSVHCFLSHFKRPCCTSKKLHLREPCSVCPCREVGLQLSPVAELLMGKLLGLVLLTDSCFHQQTQAAAESPKLQADFPCAVQLSHSRVMPHRGAKTSSIKHLRASPIILLWEPVPLSGGQIQQSHSTETTPDHPGLALAPVLQNDLIRLRPRKQK